MNEAVKEVLTNLKDHHPAYDEQAGYKVSGFVWFQGSMISFTRVQRWLRIKYGEFIKDVRRIRRTGMPFVIGVWALAGPQTK